MSKKETFEKEKQALVEDFGWSEEDAAKFLNDKVGVRQIQVNGRMLPAVLEKLCRIGVPFNPVQVQFIVPESRWEEFEKATQEAVAPEGGFVISQAEAALMAKDTPETLN